MRFTEEIMRPIEFRCQERIQFFFDDIASCVNAGAEVCVRAAIDVQATNRSLPDMRIGQRGGSFFQELSFGRESSERQGAKVRV
jgi:hypothetical protein